MIGIYLLVYVYGYTQPNSISFSEKMVDLDNTNSDTYISDTPIVKLNACKCYKHNITQVIYRSYYS